MEIIFTAVCFAFILIPIPILSRNTRKYRILIIELI